MATVTAKSGTLAQRLKTSGSETSVVIQSNESWDDVTTGVLKIGLGNSREWCSFTDCTETSSNGVYTITFTGVARGLEKNAANSTDTAAGNKKNHNIGDPVALVFHSYQINDLASLSGDNTFSGNSTITGSWVFQSTTKSTLRLQHVETADLASLTGVQDGDLLYNTTLDVAYLRAGGSWQPIEIGGTPPDATESVKGYVELATVTDQQNAAATGSTGAGLALQARYLVSSSAGAGDAYKLAILNSSGVYDSTFMPASSYKFGGDGSDGDVSGAVTITGSDNSYIVKNYDDFIPGANTITTSTANSIIHIKVKGTCNLTGTTFDFRGKGATGGAGGTAVTASATVGNIGTVGTDGKAYFAAAQNGLGGPGGTSGGVPTSGAAANALTYALSTDLSSIVLGGRSLPFGCGAGGGGGGSGYMGTSSGGSSGAGGTGGAGGGCFILEVLGDITFSSTTLDVRGAVGSTGGVGIQGGVRAGTAAGGGGGGGGSGGTYVVMYGGTATGSPTSQVTGGAGGAGGAGDYEDSTLRFGGGGGSGASSQYADGTAGSSTSNDDGGAGGAGATGVGAVIKNTVFQ